MTKAENYQVLLDGARTQQERNALLDQAANESIVGEFDQDDHLTILAFPDGSELNVYAYHT